MASIFKRNGIYQVKLKRHGKWVYRSLRTRNRAMAEKFRKQARSLEDGAPTLPNNPDALTLRDMADLVLDDATATNTYKAISVALKAAGEAFANAPVSSISRRDIASLRASWARLKPRTRNHYLQMYSLLVTRCQRRAIYDGDNPFKTEQAEAVPKRQPRWLSNEQLSQLLNTAQKNPSIYAALILGAYAGLRVGEIAHARWDWLDTDKRLLHVRAGEGWVPKGNKERTLPLHQRIAALPHSPGPRIVGLAEQTIRHAVRALANELSIPWLTPHVLRHTFASHAVMAGVPLYTVSHWLGHASITTTQVYAHLAPQHEMIDRLG